ncbi:MAG: chain length-determining protein [Rhodocyclaceae bacterium]|nr:MAG: chain length-determining protein [Rhodocyclaceae bacterium]
MDKVILEVLLHLRAMWRYRWWGLLTAWGVAVLFAVVVLLMPKKYEASARIFVNTDSILKPLMQGVTVQPDNGQRVSLLSRLVISRPNVEQLIKETGLDEKVTTTEQRERLIDNVIKVLDIQTSGSEKDNIFVIKFRDTKPERAKRVVELMVEKFINSSKGGRATDNEAAKEFLDDQVASYEKKLQEAESRLKDFKLQNMVGISPTEGKDSFAQMATIGEQLNLAQMQLREAENSRDAYRRGLAGEDVASTPAAITTAGGDTLSDIDARMDSMKRNLDSLLQRYTDSHPDVVGARRVIKELEEQRRRLVAEYRKAGIPLTQVAVGGQRASEQLKVSLAQAEASAASLRARVSELSARYAQMKDTARRMPELEAQLAQLNRDYEVNKKNYDNLVARRESANISEDMQSVSGVADFRLIDPPRVAPNPVSPSRALMLIASLFVAAGLGAGLMFLAKEIRGRVYDRSQLREFGLPILGVVSMVASDQRVQDSRMRLQRFLRVTGMLGGAYVVVVIVCFVLTKPVS